MKTNQETILAFYPNARGFGYAIFKGPLNPKECSVACVTTICNIRSIKRLKKLIEVYQPSMIILEEIEKVRKYDRVKKLLKKTASYANENKIAVERISREQIRDVLPNSIHIPSIRLLKEFGTFFQTIQKECLYFVNSR